MASVSSKQAAAYLIDPLHAPEPSQETGPGSHFVAPVEQSDKSSIPRDLTGSSVGSNNPYRQHISSPNSEPRSHHRSSPSSGSHGHHRSSPSSGSHHSPMGRHSRNTSLSSQPDKFPHYRHEAFGNGSPPAYDAVNDSRPRRSSSLRERYPGDDSHKPLDIIRRDSKKASRSPHLHKRHMPGVDSVDGLDHAAPIAYHHEGPYDAASMARNSIPGKSPIDALKTSNEEALKATPPENVTDSVRRHVPLSGTAIVPPGEEDRFGRRYSYEEGPNQMIEGQPEGGPYKRYGGVTYHPDDIKGKGEPSYSRDLAEKEKEKERRSSGHRSSMDGAIELSDASGNRPRVNSLKDGLKKRLSIRKKHDD